MGKSTPSAPAAPDPAKTAAAQAAANKESAIATGQLNMVNQYTPYGNLEYTQRGTSEEGTPQYSATQTLAPEQQNLLDLTTQAGQQYGETANTQLGAVKDTLAQPLDYSGLGPAPEINEASRQQATDAILGRMQPQWDRDQAMLDTKLANQGIGYGSDAYMAAMDDLNRGKTDARLAADAYGGNEMARQFGLESTARDRSINELVQQRSIPLNELSAMLSGTQVQGPQYVNTPQTQVDPADIMGATYGSYNGQMDAYGQQMANSSANTQGLYSLLGTGAAMLAFSDRRLKRDIVKIGKLPNGLDVYSFMYLWGQKAVGLMADEVKKINPHAVVNIGGFDAVDYKEAIK